MPRRVLCHVTLVTRQSPFQQLPTQLCKLSQHFHRRLRTLNGINLQGYATMYSIDTERDHSPPGQAAPNRQSAGMARSWLYRLAEQSGFGQLEPQAQDNRLPPDFDQRVRQVGEW